MKKAIVYDPQGHRLFITNIQDLKKYREADGNIPRWSNKYDVSVSPREGNGASEYIGTVKLNSLPPLAAAMRRLGLVERQLYVKDTA